MEDQSVKNEQIVHCKSECGGYSLYNSGLDTSGSGATVGEGGSEGDTGNYDFVMGYPSATDASTEVPSSGAFHSAFMFSSQPSPGTGDMSSVPFRFASDTDPVNGLDQGRVVSPLLVSFGRDFGTSSDETVTHMFGPSKGGGASRPGLPSDSACDPMDTTDLGYSTKSKQNGHHGESPAALLQSSQNHHTSLHYDGSTPALSPSVPLRNTSIDKRTKADHRSDTTSAHPLLHQHYDPLYLFSPYPAAISSGRSASTSQSSDAFPYRDVASSPSDTFSCGTTSSLLPATTTTPSGSSYRGQRSPRDVDVQHHSSQTHSVITALLQRLFQIHRAQLGSTLTVKTQRKGDAIAYAVDQLSSTELLQLLKNVLLFQTGSSHGRTSSSPDILGHHQTVCSDDGQTLANMLATSDTLTVAQYLGDMTGIPDSKFLQAVAIWCRQQLLTKDVNDVNPRSLLRLLDHDDHSQPVSASRQPIGQTAASPQKSASVDTLKLKSEPTMALDSDKQTQVNCCGSYVMSSQELDPSAGTDYSHNCFPMQNTPSENPGHQSDCGGNTNYAGHRQPPEAVTDSQIRPLINIIATVVAKLQTLHQAVLAQAELQANTLAAIVESQLNMDQARIAKQEISKNDGIEERLSPVKVRLRRSRTTSAISNPASDSGCPHKRQKLVETPDTSQHSDDACASTRSESEFADGLENRSILGASGQTSPVEDICNSGVLADEAASGALSTPPQSDDVGESPHDTQTAARARHDSSNAPMSAAVELQEPCSTAVNLDPSRPPEVSTRVNSLLLDVVPSSDARPLSFEPCTSTGEDELAPKNNPPSQLVQQKTNDIKPHIMDDDNKTSTTLIQASGKEAAQAASSCSYEQCLMQLEALALATPHWARYRDSFLWHRRRLLAEDVSEQKTAEVITQRTKEYLKLFLEDLFCLEMPALKGSALRMTEAEEQDSSETLRPPLRPLISQEIISFLSPYDSDGMAKESWDITSCGLCGFLGTSQPNNGGSVSCDGPVNTSDDTFRNGSPVVCPVTFQQASLRLRQAAELIPLWTARLDHFRSFHDPSFAPLTALLPFLQSTTLFQFISSYVPVARRQLQEALSRSTPEKPTQLQKRYASDVPAGAAATTLTYQTSSETWAPATYERQQEFSTEDSMNSSGASAATTLTPVRSTFDACGGSKLNAQPSTDYHRVSSAQQDLVLMGQVVSGGGGEGLAHSHHSTHGNATLMQTAGGGGAPPSGYPSAYSATSVIGVLPSYVSSQLPPLSIIGRPGSDLSSCMTATSQSSVTSPPGGTGGGVKPESMLGSFSPGTSPGTLIGTTTPRNDPKVNNLLLSTDGSQAPGLAGMVPSAYLSNNGSANLVQSSQSASSGTLIVQQDGSGTGSPTSSTRPSSGTGGSSTPVSTSGNNNRKMMIMVCTAKPAAASSVSTFLPRDDQEIVDEQQQQPQHAGGNGDCWKPLSQQNATTAAQASGSREELSTEKSKSALLNAIAELTLPKQLALQEQAASSQYDLRGTVKSGSVSAPSQPPFSSLSPGLSSFDPTKVQSAELGTCSVSGTSRATDYSKMSGLGTTPTGTTPSGDRGGNGGSSQRGGRSGVQGVVWNSDENSWIAFWQDPATSQQQVRRFPVSQFGADGAKRMAMKCRREADRQLTATVRLGGQNSTWTGKEGDGIPQPPRSEVQGVYWYRNRNGWVAQWFENGKNKHKFFAASVFGVEGAKQKAIAYRLMKLEEKRAKGW